MYVTKISKVIPVIACLLFASAPVPATTARADACNYWVAPPPEGDDDHAGTLASPWATLAHAAESVPDAYCTVWFKEGEYFGNHRLNRRFKTPTTFKSFTPYQAIFLNDTAIVNISGGKNITLEGFIFRHTGQEAGPLLVSVDRSKEGWSEWIVFRNNIFHDSFNNDLLKIHNGSRYVTVQGNVFYNQGSSEQHLDINSVTDVTIQDNILFNDYAGSGRVDPKDSKHFIVIKDSNGNEDGLEGSARITVRRNIFLNWEGGEGETFVQIGNDGKPYYEARSVRIENNLMIGNAPNKIGAALGIRGARDVFFINNTIVGDLPSSAYAFSISLKDLNPQNQNIYFYNNIWSDPTGTMGADLSGGSNKFSNGDPEQTSNLILNNNLYWNGGETIPAGKLVSPLVHDSHRIVANPQLNTHHDAILLPRWSGSAFLSGSKTIREEFIRLVETYGRIMNESPASGHAEPAYAPHDDILSNFRPRQPDLGAFEDSPASAERIYLPMAVKIVPGKYLKFGR